jgi:hypothetical protein
MLNVSHSFSVFIATQEGIVEAILMQHFYHLQTAYANNLEEAKKTLVVRSVRALQGTYPYLKPKQIRGALERMFESGLIIQESAAGYDRTKGYKLSEKAWRYFLEMPFAERANGFAERANRSSQKGKSYIGSYSSFYSIEEEEGAGSNFSPEAENKMPPQVPAPPPIAPGDSGPKRYGIDLFDAADRMKNDFRAAEMFQSQTGRPQNEFAQAVDQFTKEQEALLSTYNNDRDYRQHFFNVQRIKKTSAEISARQQTPKKGLNFLGSDHQQYTKPQAF